MKLHVTATDFELDRELEKYIDSKIADIHKELPRKLRANSACDVTLSQRGKGRNKVSTCTLVIDCDGETFRAQESTQHLYAALDIATVHAMQQLQSYFVAQGYKPPKGEWPLP